MIIVRPMARLLLVVAATALLIFVAFEGIDLPQTWVVPDGYQGWLRMQYLDPSCPPLTRAGLVVVTGFDATGYACTSDDAARGWHGFGIEYAGSGQPVPPPLRRVAFTIPTAHREAVFIGPADDADLRQLPQEWGGPAPAGSTRP